MTTSKTPAADLLEKGWCQSNCATNKSGMPIEFWFEDACRFCALGAIWRSYAPQDSSRDRVTALLLAKVGKIHAWNDKPGRTQQEVVEAVRAAELEVQNYGQ